MNPEFTHILETTAEDIRQHLDATTAIREQALSQSRQLIRACSLAIRAVHRDDLPTMQTHLQQAETLTHALQTSLQTYPALYFAGYTQDAIKEYAEARITCALIQGQPLPSRKALNIEPATYLRGLAESIGELRRRILHLLRAGYTDESRRLLAYMEDIYAILVTMDYPDAITYGLRRQTDIARSIIERTESDITFNLESRRLGQALEALQKRLHNL